MRARAERIAFRERFADSVAAGAVLAFFGTRAPPDGRGYPTTGRSNPATASTTTSTEPRT